MTAADVEVCRSWIRQHSKSFYLSSLLLPKRVRRSAWALYAFCRRADDAVDVEAGGGLRRLEGLRARLDAVYRGVPEDHAIDRAFSGVVEEFQIPRPLPEALLDGMELDARGFVCETDEDLLGYCFRVASTVGLMMTQVMGYADPVALLRAADLGVAMQLTNIARDVGEDARRGRVYIPKRLVHEVGLDPRTLADGPTEASRTAVRRLLARADAHYRAADAGVPLLPRSCRLAIASSRRIYSGIGQAIARNGYDSITRRAHIGLWGKLARVACASSALFSHAGEYERRSIGPADAQLRRHLQTVGLA